MFTLGIRSWPGWKGRAVPLPAPREVTMPELGLGGATMTLSRWWLRPGQTVVAGDRLVEVLSGSVTVDLPAPATGVLSEIMAREGERLGVGQRLAEIEP